MNINKFTDLGKSLEGIKGAVIVKWQSHDDHEDIVIKDFEHNRYEIKFYPNKELRKNES
jgi:hypothetical protein